jgi:hypothetical protein
MAYSRGRHLSKRQKRRSLKMKNVKSRKVMRGGWNNLNNCNSEYLNLKTQPEQAAWMKKNGLGGQFFQHGVTCQKLVGSKK